ncbi:hypothetical protein E0Z10_g9373 [Xylaria hypoxylon]|uniref:HNH nuclease domain-containing protein n=1 Tax=Xylaria hypoxylon TaxID=37992 RepID=A0A4Z0Y6E8_9PEZI|nr:hypothetical protein E0Z10_g9373 [Xylaria hypoxylon]
MVKCRDCFDPPIARHINVPRDPERVISFRHPAYPVSANDLLCLSAIDDDPVRGIDYNIALVACGIIACNKWHQAWFGEKCEGGDEELDRYRRVPRPKNGILPYKESPYYFFVNEDVKYKYPVVPSFEHWPFPHKSLPDGWKRMCPPSTSGGETVTLPEDHRIATSMRDRGCRITGYLQGTEIAHLVPTQAMGWFEVNLMKQYCRHKIRINPVDDDANMLMLRRDLHFMFDQRQLVVVPKVNSKATTQIQTEGQQHLTREQIIPTSPIGPTCSDQPTYPVIHVLLPDGHDELRTLYHNRLLQPTFVSASDIAPEFLFARFAWAILSDEYYRLLKSDWLQYRVLIFDPETGKRQEQDMRRKALDQNVHLFSRRSRSRNVSPRKRRIESVEDEVGDYDDLYNDNNNLYLDRIDRELSRSRDGELEGNDDDELDRYDGEPFRGRSRWRLPNTAHPQPHDLNHCSRSLPSHESSFNSYSEFMSPITIPDSPCLSHNLGSPKAAQQDQPTVVGKDSLEMRQRKRRRFNR